MWKEWWHQPTDISCWNYLISKKEYQNKQWSYFKTFLIGCSIFISLLITFRKCLWKYLPHTTFSYLKSWLLSAKIKSWSFPSSRPMWGEDVPFAQKEPKDKIWGKGERAKDEMLLFVSLLAYQTSCVLLTRKTVIVLLLSRTQSASWKTPHSTSACTSSIQHSLSPSPTDPRLTSHISGPHQTQRHSHTRRCVYSSVGRKLLSPPFALRAFYLPSQYDHPPL